MRNIISISLPMGLKKQVDKVVKEENYGSVSEFFRDAVRAWQEEQLYQSVLISEKEFNEGKGKKLRSLRDLM
jgi:Arc/MetJ-type ribon-helix-helix transcriptional regulator